MTRLYLLLFTLILGSCSLGAYGQIDSLSYALGYRGAIDEMEFEKELLKNDDDFKEYLRGLEDNRKKLFLGQPQLSNDSSYMVSYALGGMECVFIADASYRKSGKQFPFFSYIIDGLRKVERNEITLPVDTVAALAFIEKVVKENPNPEELDEETNCKFFTSYGIMKAFQPGLQAYIEGIMPGTQCKEDRQAYAAGMADFMEALTQKPDSPYFLGRLQATEFFLTSLQTDKIDFDSYLLGTKAALGLGEELMTRENVEAILTIDFSHKSEYYDKNYDLLEEPIAKLDVILETPYYVNWDFKAARVVKEQSPVTETFFKLINSYGGLENYYHDFLMAQMADEDGKLYENISAEIKETSLPDGYQWFCGRKDNSVFIGIMDTAESFNTEVHNAKVEVDTVNTVINVVWNFEGTDVNKWADFTQANIQQHIAVEINGIFIFAPKVNSQITGGMCSASDLSPEVINTLFKDAKFTFEMQQE